MKKATSTSVAPTAAATKAATVVDDDVDSDDVVDDGGQPVTRPVAARSFAAAGSADDIVDDHGQPVSHLLGGGGHLSGWRPASTDELNPKPAAEHLAPGMSDNPIGAGLSSLGSGIWKGAKSTGTGILRLGAKALPDSINPLKDPDTSHAVEDSIRSDNPLESVGKFIEQTAEMFIPGAMVEKSVQATKGLSTARRIADAMWKESLATGGTTFLQTGGDPKAAAIAGVTGGAIRGVASTPMFLRDAKLADEVLQEAQKYGIPLTKAEQTQSSIRRFVDFLVTRSVGGAKTMAKFKVDRNAMIENTARTIANSVEADAMDPRSMGLYVQHALDQVREAATLELRQRTDDVLSGAWRELLDLGSVSPAGAYKPSKLVQAARDIIGERRYRQIDKFLDGSQGATDNTNEAYRILDKFAHPTVTLPDGTVAVKQMDVVTAKELRTLLFDKSAFSETTSGKASIQRLNQALHEELVDTLNRGGLSTEAKAFEAASGDYKETLRKLESRLITHLSRRGDMGAQQVAPETIAAVLRGSAGESTSIELARLLKPDQIQRVRGSLLRQTIEETQHPKGYWDVEKFKREIDGFGDAGGSAIYGADLYKELKGFAKAAERYKITPIVKDQATGEALPLLAQLRLTAIAGGAAGMLTKTHSPTAALGAAAAVGGETIGMAVLARMLTRPGVVHDLTRALAADPASTLGKQLAARISAYAAREASDMKGEEASKEFNKYLRSGGNKGTNGKSGAGLPPPPDVVNDDGSADGGSRKFGGGG